MADENKDNGINQVSCQETEDEPCCEAKDSRTESTEDKELDDLLDSALEDFDKPVVPPPQPDTGPSEQTTAEPSSQSTPSPATPSNDLPSQQEALFNEIFKMAGSEEGGGSGVDQLETMMQQFMAKQPDLMQQVDQMVQNPDGGGTFEETLQQTLGSLAQNAEDLQNQSPDGDLLQMLSGMGLDGEGATPSDGEELDFMPMMQNMMKSLMSKEVLYPSLKEITDKYPAWLQENSSKAESTEYKKYEKQYQLMKQIVDEFELEKSEDSEATKQARFHKIMNIMQDMQTLGQPPKDIVGDMPPGMELDANGLPKFPPNPEQCSIM